ncbi:MAG: Flp pilus assembly complex ATPase component TadA [Magnetococcales bacterium]|nr:Flp pilus assembly complex ATPase component TadA [Magnetococcales bacterium]
MTSHIPYVLQKPLQLGDLLIDAGVITRDKLTIALTEQKKTGEPLGHALVRLGFVAEEEMRDLLSNALGQPSIELDGTRLDPKILAMVPRRLIERHQVIPVHWDGRTSSLTLAMSDTFDEAVIDKIQANIQPDITLKTILAGQSEIARAIQRAFGVELSLEENLREIETGRMQGNRYPTDSTGRTDSPLVRLVDGLIGDALLRSASEVHIDPELGLVRIRYRIDGVMTEIRCLHKDHFAGLAGCIKELAGLNPSATDTPLEGGFSRTLAARSIDLQICSHPTLHGESLLLRILDRGRGIPTLEELGLSQPVLGVVRGLLARPTGILLIAGSRGSGRTTTLLSLLQALNTPQVKIMTLEDPPHHPLEMVGQAIRSPSATLEPTSQLAALLRQEPDILALDTKTNPTFLPMLFQAALQGTKILTTLSGNSAIGVLSHLRELGIPASLLAESLQGILRQHLVRLLCPHCKRPRDPTPRERQQLGNPSTLTGPVFSAFGCGRCHGSGYHGRAPVLETLPMDRELACLIEQNAPRNAIEQWAQQRSLPTPAQDALRLITQGLSSLEELGRVLDLPQNPEG